MLVLSWLPIAAGVTAVVPLLIGIVVLDMAAQGTHVTNQSVIYRMHPEARNRLTAGYMTSYFIGGALGSLISAYAYQHFGWLGVSSAGGLLSLLGLLVWWRSHHHESSLPEAG
ncbi:hypothetical protein OS12_40780 [Dickeya oryzae]